MEHLSAEHLWPALYPAMILGGLIGLTARSAIGGVLGVAGGILGALAGLLFADLAGIDVSLMRLVSTILPAAAGAFALLRLWQRFTAQGQR